jgi:hypothetical protein
MSVQAPEAGSETGAIDTLLHTLTVPEPCQCRDWIGRRLRGCQEHTGSCCERAKLFEACRAGAARLQMGSDVRMLMSRERMIQKGPQQALIIAARHTILSSFHAFCSSWLVRS